MTLVRRHFRWDSREAVFASSLVSSVAIGVIALLVFSQLPSTKAATNDHLGIVIVPVLAFVFSLPVVHVASRWVTREELGPPSALTWMAWLLFSAGTAGFLPDWDGAGIGIAQQRPFITGLVIATGAAGALACLLSAIRATTLAPNELFDARHRETFGSRKADYE